MQCRSRYVSCHALPSTFFFFTDTATTEIYTLSLHDALPISCLMYGPALEKMALDLVSADRVVPIGTAGDRKSTRLSSSHVEISYAVFCLKKKNKKLLFLFVLFSLSPFRTLVPASARGTRT